MQGKKLLLALGLVGLLGLSYGVARHSDTGTTTPAKEVGLVKKNDKTVAYPIPVSAYASIPMPPPSSMDNDSYKNYVNSLNLPPTWLYEELSIYGLPGCDEQEIRRRHEKISQRIPRETEECLLDGSVDQLIRLDRKLANCKYKNDAGGFNELLEEIAEHFESTNRSIAAGRIHHFIGNLNKATESLLQDKMGGVEYVLKITPPEELPPIADYYLQGDDPFNAGKVEWFLGDRNLGRVLIKLSELYQEKMKEEVMRYLSVRNYQWAAQALEELRLPFHQELAQELCGGNEDCLWEFEKYRPFE